MYSNQSLSSTLIPKCYWRLRKVISQFLLYKIVYKTEKGHSITLAFRSSACIRGWFTSRKKTIISKVCFVKMSKLILSKPLLMWLLWFHCYSNTSMSLLVQKKPTCPLIYLWTRSLSRTSCSVQGFSNSKPLIGSSREDMHSYSGY